MNTPEDVQAMNEIQADIKLGESLARLKKNKDFKAVIQDLFLDGGAVNLTKNINVVKNQDEVIEQIRSRGYLYRFLMEIEQNHNGAVQELIDLQALEQEEKEK